MAKRFLCPFWQHAQRTLIHRAGGIRNVSGMSPIDPTSLRMPAELLSTLMMATAWTEVHA